MMSMCCARGGTPRVFDEVYAPSTFRIFLREFSLRPRRPARRRAPPASGGAGAAGAAAGGHRAARVFGHRLAAAPGLRDSQAGRLVRACQDRRPGAAAPGSVAADHHDLDGDRAAGDRRGAAALGRAGSGRAAARQVKQAITTARKCGAGTIMLRGDSAFGTKKVIAACLEEGVEFLPVGEPK